MDAICFKYIYLHLVNKFRGTFSDRVSGGGWITHFQVFISESFCILGWEAHFPCFFFFVLFLLFHRQYVHIHCIWYWYFEEEQIGPSLLFVVAGATELGDQLGVGGWWMVGAMMKEYFQRGTKTHVSSPGIKNSFSSSAAVLVGTACPAQGHFLSGEEGPRIEGTRRVRMMMPDASTLLVSRGKKTLLWQNVYMKQQFTMQ